MKNNMSNKSISPLYAPKNSVSPTGVVYEYKSKFKTRRKESNMKDTIYTIVSVSTVVTLLSLIYMSAI